MNEVQYNNRVFIDAIAGVLLFIIALAYTVTHIALITAAVKAHYILIPAVLGASALYFIFKSLKNDKHRILKIS